MDIRLVTIRNKYFLKGDIEYYLDLKYDMSLKISDEDRLKEINRIRKKYPKHYVDFYDAITEEIL